MNEFILSLPCSDERLPLLPDAISNVVNGRRHTTVLHQRFFDVVRNVNADGALCIYDKLAWHNQRRVLMRSALVDAAANIMLQTDEEKKDVGPLLSNRSSSSSISTTW